jgi:hypothetical protein
MSPKKKSRKEVRRRTPRPARAGMQSRQSPKARMPSLFQLVHGIVSAADRTMAAAAQLPPEGDREKRLLLFDLNQLERGRNALQAVGILCGEAPFWEFASGTVRQLFELVLNMEHLATFADREDAIDRYSEYGLLQQLEHSRRYLRYVQKKSGAPVDEALSGALDELLDDEKSFPEFRSKTKDGKLKNKPSWSGYSARYLAEKSKNPLRVTEYDLLFTEWSEEAHGTPRAVLPGLLAADNDPEDIAATEYGQTANTVAMAITLFVELWTLLPHVPDPDAGQFTAWRIAAGQEALKYALYRMSRLTRM